MSRGAAGAIGGDACVVPVSPRTHFGLDACANWSISIRKFSWCEEILTKSPRGIGEPPPVANSKICCIYRCNLNDIAACRD